jgi:hypothetical protein
MLSSDQYIIQEQQQQQQHNNLNYNQSKGDSHGQREKKMGIDDEEEKVPKVRKIQ